VGDPYVQGWRGKILFGADEISRGIDLRIMYDFLFLESSGHRQAMKTRKNCEKMQRVSA
jgi:hypothetical protein